MDYSIPNIFQQIDDQLTPLNYLIGYDHFIYFNLDEPVDDTGFSNWRLRFYGVDGTMLFDAGALTKHTISGSDCRFYDTVTFTYAVPQNTCMIMAIIDVSDGSILHVVNRPVYAIDQDELLQYTWFKYRNTTDYDYYPYENALFSGKYNDLIISANNIEHAFEHEFTGYRQKASKEYKRQKTGRHKRIGVETYLLDEGLDDVFGSISDHDTILINGEAVTVQEAHVNDNNRDFNLGNGKINFYVDKYSTTNYKN